MPSQQIVVQQPQGKSQQLILLFHGVGDNPASMAEVGRYLAQTFSDSWIVSIGSPYDCDLGRGYQWFSVQGVTEHNRSARIEEVLPLFEQRVQYWQQQSGVDAAHTVLIGFSQGAIMSLEACVRQPDLAGVVVSLSGRLARLPDALAAQGPQLHFIHGDSDPVIDVDNACQAASYFQAQGWRCSLDIITQHGHGINQQVLTDVIKRLQGEVVR
jgi:phospholipase/carboxylesterase